MTRAALIRDGFNEVGQRTYSDGSKLVSMQVAQP